MLELLIKRGLEFRHPTTSIDFSHSNPSPSFISFYIKSLALTSRQLSLLFYRESAVIIVMEIEQVHGCGEFYILKFSLAQVTDVVACCTCCLHSADENKVRPRHVRLFGCMSFCLPSTHSANVLCTSTDFLLLQKRPLSIHCSKCPQQQQQQHGMTLV